MTVTKPEENMRKPSDIFRDMMSDHFSKNRNDDLPLTHSHFAGLREAICQYLDETIPILEQKVEQLEKKLDSSKIEYTMKDWVDGFKSTIDIKYRNDYKLLICPECGKHVGSQYIGTPKYPDKFFCSLDHLEKFESKEQKPECEHDWSVNFDFKNQCCVRRCTKYGCNKKQIAVTTWQDN